MKTTKPSKRTRGRHRFKTKFVEESPTTSVPYGGPPEATNLAQRHKLLKFLPKRVGSLLPFNLPSNFAQTADKLLREKQMFVDVDFS